MRIIEFFYWLKGFSEAVNPYNVTPKQWETILEKLNSVESVDAKEEFDVEYHYYYDNDKTTTTADPNNRNVNIING
jgi:hypothetical protein